MKRTERWTAISLATLLLAPSVVPPAGGTQDSEQAGGFARTDEALSSLVGGLAVLPTPEQEAKDAYDRGLGYRDKARKLEEQAATAEAEKAAKKVAKAEKSYKKAIAQFRMAIEQVPDFHQALGGLCHGLLRTGQHGEALEACDRALAIESGYLEAIEYRGEAYLGLDRLEEAKDAYTQLFVLDRERAAELMTAMKRWLNERRDAAGSVSAETIEDFATWIE